MKKVNHIIINKHQLVVKYLIFISSLFCIYLSFPEGGLFEYEFKKNDPWRYEDLIAEFDFRIEKSEEEYKSDLEKEKSFVVPFYTYDRLILVDKIETFNEDFEAKFEDLMDKISNKDEIDLKIKRKKLLNDSTDISNYGSGIINRIYTDGIIDLDEQHEDYSPSKYIKLQKGKFTEKIKIRRLRTNSEALKYINSKLNASEQHFKYLLEDLIIEPLKYNIQYDEYSTEKYFRQNQTVIRYKGSIQQGQKIISKGDVIENELYQVLYSYNKEYNDRKVGNQSLFLVKFGFLILASLCLSIIII